MTWLPTIADTPPAEEPVSLAEARAQLHVDVGDTDFDTEFTIYIKAAREHAEEITGTKFITQTVLMQADSFCALKRLPMAPLQSIESITYLDSDGAEQTLDPAVYRAVLADMRPSIQLKVGQSWPGLQCTPDAVRVTAIAGYGDAAAVPAKAKQAMLLMVGDWNRNREDSAPVELESIPHGARALLKGLHRFRGL